MQQHRTLTDEQLLALLQQHDEAAFTEIYNRYWEKLLATAKHFTQDKQAAEDVVHEVMISLWSRRSDNLVNSISAYLATAVKFAVFKFIAREKRRQEVLHGPVTVDTDADLIDKLDAKFMEELLLKRSEEFPAKARLVFDYHRKQQLTIAQIANKLNLSPKAVEYHMTKALRLLRTLSTK